MSSRAARGLSVAAAFVAALAISITMSSAYAQSAATQTAKPQSQAASSQAASSQAPASQAKQGPIKEPVTAKGCPRVPGKPYFVEFRSRTAASYGHTFVFFGKLGSGKSFASFKVAGLHPKGDDPAVYLQGHLFPVEAETGVSYGDLDEQYLTARFCVALNEVEFKRAVAYIAHLQTTTKTWHATTYNCNSFAADIAKHIGLDTPNPNAYLPEIFIKRLAEDNRNWNASGKDNSAGKKDSSGGFLSGFSMPFSPAPTGTTN